MKKAILIILIGLFTLNGCVTTKKMVKNSQTDLAQKGYLIALKSGKSGLIEDVLFQIALCHLQNNLECSVELKAQIATLAENGETVKIRKRSEMVQTFLDINDPYFLMDLKSEYYGRSRLFSKLADFLRDDESRPRLQIDLQTISSTNGF